MTRNTSHALKESIEISKAARQIHQLARAGANVRFTRRADRQMDALGIMRPDILTILKKCRVTRLLGSSVRESLHYRVQGNTIDERGVGLIVRIEEQPLDTIQQLAVIHVQWIDGERGNHEEMPKVQVEYKK
jgi:hypothetical protein